MATKTYTIVTCDGCNSEITENVVRFDIVGFNPNMKDDKDKRLEDHLHFCGTDCILKGVENLITKVWI